MSKKTFKNLDHCSKHDKYYHWKAGCEPCKKERRPKQMKKLDEVFKQMEEDGIIPKVSDVVKNTDSSS